MSLRSLPEIKAFERPDGYGWDAPSKALSRWAEMPRAESGDPATISIYDVIGEDLWTGGGFTARRMAGALRAIGPKPVTVAINSPGGDVFEGLAIYNLLRQHPAAVAVEVMGIAASIASVIAMAGDTVAMGMGSFLMIHNAWGASVGDRNEFRAAADVLEQIDGAMADIYDARSGAGRKKITAMMDAETFLTAREAVDQGFADETTTDPVPTSDQSAAAASLDARKRLDACLAKGGMPRSERRRLFRHAIDTPGAVDGEPAATLRAGLDHAAVARLIATIKA